MSSKLLVVGTIAYDTIQTPHAKADKIFGGSATHIALASSKFNLDCSIISIVGNDFEKKHLDLLREKGINTSGISISKKGKTFKWSGQYFSDMKTRKTIDTQLNVLEEFEPKVLSEFSNPDILVLANLHPEIQINTLSQIRKKPKLIVLDTMNFWIESFRSPLNKIISMVDVISINDEEALMLTGENSITKAVKKIINMGPEFVIVKEGHKGASLFYNGKSFFVPSFPVKEVIDPTGAGDSFIGGFVGYLAEQDQISIESIKKALIYACAMGSFIVEKFGSENLINLPLESIKLRVNAIKEMTKFENQ